MSSSSSFRAFLPSLNLVSLIEPSVLQARAENRYAWGSFGFSCDDFRGQVSAANSVDGKPNRLNFTAKMYTTLGLQKRLVDRFQDEFLILG